ncbi:tyrosine-type recombinase/integrase [Fluviicola taffensis]|uniref:Tyrosine recombinase xerC n=1 Tax=Fluviicola taffensis (strain DSM 16823 / NCIMB 13979 / RW262) TaxID=755732 RepID=F2I9X9_FLUTR|nr:tyrosine-type recombinase/integrase [Fluviicola taffensis]AEA44137.1 Tyrosine recombinase xerC [Fluviicola taffensis DSM 16823]
MSYKDSFIHYLEVEKRYSKHTILAYEEDLNQFVSFSELKESVEWREVNYQLVRAWVVGLLESGQSNRTVSRKISCLRSFFKWLINEGKIGENPMLRIRGPKVEKRLPQFVKQTEIDGARIEGLFSSNFEGVRDRLMFELFYQTGIRLSELIELKNKDVSSVSIKVLGKRNKERIIPIGQELHEIILAYQSIKPGGPDSQILLFVKKDGRKLSPKFVYRKINTYLGSVTNVQKKSPHILRHTFATHMLNNGAGLETLKELLGHANLSATQVYTHNSFAQINSIYSHAHPRGRKK